MDNPKIKTPYKIILFKESKHTGAIEHIGIYSCGFWHNVNGKLISLHRDVKSFEECRQHTNGDRPPASHLAKALGCATSTVSRAYETVDKGK